MSYVGNANVAAFNQEKASPCAAERERADPLAADWPPYRFTYLSYLGDPGANVLHLAVA